MSLNKVCLIGHLGQDPESRTTPSGTAVVSASLATTEKWKDKNGERQERTTWFRLAFFGKLGDIAAQYLNKGSLVYVEGSVSASAWTDKQSGEARASLEVRVREMKMLGGKPADAKTQNAPRQQSRPLPAVQTADEFDNDINF